MLLIMSMLMQLVLMNMLTLMQDGDMQMPWWREQRKGSWNVAPGWWWLLSDSAFQMDTQGSLVFPKTYLFITPDNQDLSFLLYKDAISVVLERP